MPRLYGGARQWGGSDGDRDSSGAKLSAPAVLHSPRPLLEERRPSAATRRSRANTARSSSRRRQRAPTGDDQSPPPPSRSRSPLAGQQPPLQMSDRQLAQLAHSAAATVDWGSLRARSSVWDKRKSRGDFGVYTRRCGRAYHVMATGSVACSVTEMYHVLCTTSTARYAAAMQELHGASFVTGEVVHRVNTRHALAATACGVSSLRDGGDMVDLTVKTATFAKAHVLARAEHWCFLELFQPQADKQKFVLTMHSLQPDAVRAPPDASTNQLHELSAGYSVVADPRRGLVWVMFYAQFVDPPRAGVGGLLFKREHASKSTLKARVMQMARATCCLPMIVRRRRLGAQVFIDSAAFTPPNTHCICCTAALPLLARRQRCHLCGYCVCAACSSTQEIERAHTHLAPPPRRRPLVRVCRTCSRRVDNANYDNIPGGTLSPCAIARDAPGAAPPSRSLAGLLRHSFEAAEDAARRRAIARVAGLLLEQSADDVALDVSSSAPDIGALEETSRKLARDSELVALLDTHLRVPEFALDECVLGNAECRSYPITYKSEEDGAVPQFPAPPGDDLRMSAGRQQRLLASLTNAPELEVICAIACKELQCPTGIVTLVGRSEVHVLACSNAAFRGVVVPRDDSICSHTVLSDKPLLLPFVDADVRFHRFGAVQNGALNFYCGFPLIAEDDAVLGAVCCIDTEDHAVTQAQYAVMTKLASTASRVMELRAKAEAA